MFELIFFVCFVVAGVIGYIIGSIRGARRSTVVVNPHIKETNEMADRLAELENLFQELGEVEDGKRMCDEYSRRFCGKNSGL